MCAQCRWLTSLTVSETFCFTIESCMFSFLPFPTQLLYCTSIIRRNLTRLLHHVVTDALAKIKYRTWMRAPRRNLCFPRLESDCHLILDTSIVTTVFAFNPSHYTNRFIFPSSTFAIMGLHSFILFCSSWRAIIPPWPSYLRQITLSVELTPVSSGLSP